MKTLGHDIVSVDHLIDNGTRAGGQQFVGSGLVGNVQSKEADDVHIIGLDFSLLLPMIHIMGKRQVCV
jgi:hypothetical protein